MSSSQPSDAHTDPAVDTLAGWLLEAIELRGNIARDVAARGLQQSPGELLATLQGVRRALDRVEELCVGATRARTRAQAALQDAKAVLEDAWNEHAVDPRSGFARGDAAPRERYANYSTKTVTEQFAVRRAERRLTHAQGTLDALRLIHQGLRDVRQDVDTSLRLITLESRLES